MKSNKVKNTLITQYFDVHCQIDESGYSIPVAMVGYRKQDDKSVTNHCLQEQFFKEEGDEFFIDYIKEIDEEEYNRLKNA
jgi:hypothetical protein